MRASVMTLLVLVLATSAQARPRAFAIGQKDQVTKGLVAYWSMRNSGTTVYDEKGANNGTATGNTLFSVDNGVVGAGADMDGDGDYITAFTPSSLTAWTISAWVRLDKLGSATTNVSTFIGGYVAATTSHRWYLRSEDGGKIRLGIGGGSVLSDAVLSQDVWHHVAATWDGTTARLWVDSSGKSLAGSGLTTAFPPFACPIGAFFDADGHIYTANGNANAYLDGQIDEVRIYNVALTADEIKQLYRMGRTIYDNR